MEAGEDCCVKVAVHVRPLISEEKLQGCKDCVTVVPGKPQVHYCIAALWICDSEIINSPFNVNVNVNDSVLEFFFWFRVFVRLMNLLEIWIRHCLRNQRWFFGNNRIWNYSYDLWSLLNWDIFDTKFYFWLEKHVWCNGSVSETLFFGEIGIWIFGGYILMLWFHYWLGEDVCC